MIPERGPRNTAYAEMAEIKELAVYMEEKRSHQGTTTKIDVSTTHIEYFPWIDTYADDGDNEGSSPNIDVSSMG